ncbi:Mobile element protein (plasmid) [Nostoc flagelliforme CCNUN1]|uniref:Mobile element protein n=1 Tax=Nostoc flagelliforme CCNUN1 TaxID=2038116 RepID=A0A2K8T652_9NOSO|nr:Mobile element protein [Nostoc flagelliforme CCNUN1]
MMTNPLVKIESHPQSAKRLIGINYEQFITLVALAEQRHKQKQIEIEKNKVRIIASGGGRKPKMSVGDFLMVVPVYNCE